MRVTENALTDWLAGEGFTLIEFDGRGDLWGYTSPASRTVGLWAGLRDFQRVPALLHEAHHVHLQHVGHQDQATESRINREVAKLLVDPKEYEFYESQYGWHTGGIAHALELPRWVVSAYRELLKQTAPTQ